MELVSYRLTANTPGDNECWGRSWIIFYRNEILVVIPRVASGGNSDTQAVLWQISVNGSHQAGESLRDLGREGDTFLTSPLKFSKILAHLLSPTIHFFQF